MQTGMKGMGFIVSGFAGVIAAMLSFVVTAALGIVLIPFLKKLKFGQTIKEIGPVWHKKKQGTPTMGGFMFIAGILAAVLVLAVGAALKGGAFSQANKTNTLNLIAGVFMALAFGFIGFMDDYIKVVKKRNLGLTARQKFLLQLFVGAVYLLIEYLTVNQGTTFIVPFFNWQWNLHLFYWPVALILIVGVVNSVNLTDGIDGLAGSVTFLAAIGFMLAARLAEATGFAAISAALAGGCLGFLVWNMYPAKVMMGDTGSLFLGGLLCAIAFGMGFPLLLLPIGIIYICETLSVIIQVISFKTTGKRVFKMSPIHHHFELCGWSEVKIDTVFSIITGFYGGVGYLDSGLSGQNRLVRHSPSPVPVSPEICNAGGLPHVHGGKFQTACQSPKTCPQRVRSAVFCPCHHPGGVRAGDDVFRQLRLRQLL